MREVPTKSIYVSVVLASHMSTVIRQGERNFIGVQRWRQRGFPTEESALEGHNRRVSRLAMLDLTSYVALQYRYTLTIRLDPDTLQKLRVVAEERGLGRRP